MPRLVVCLALVAACTNEPLPIKGGDPGRLCRGHADCDEGELCFHNLCTAGPTPGDPAELIALLAANPNQLNFGSVTPGESRRLALILENEGELVVTIDRAVVTPLSAPFRVEPMGSGPFWIRPGRNRALFVSYVPETSGTFEAELVIESQAPEIRLPLNGQ